MIGNGEGARTVGEVSQLRQKLASRPSKLAEFAHAGRREFSGEPDAGNPLVRFDEGIVSRTRREARCCAKDEGRPFEVALWEEIPNCRKLLRSKAGVVNVSVKRRGI